MFLACLLYKVTFNTILCICFHSLTSLFPHMMKTNLAAEMSVQSNSSAKTLSRFLQFEAGSRPGKIFHNLFSSFSDKIPLQQLQQFLQQPKSEKRVQIHGQLQQDASRGVIPPYTHSSAIQLPHAKALVVGNSHTMGMKAMQTSKNITRLYIKCSEFCLYSLLIHPVEFCMSLTCAMVIKIADSL